VEHGAGIHGSRDRAGWRLAGVTQSNHGGRICDKRIYKLSLFPGHKEFLDAHETFSEGESPFRNKTSAACTVVMEFE
jgi:hypothetical protein